MSGHAKIPVCDDQRIAKIVVPRGNGRDVLAAELFIGTLRQNEPIALEISAEANERALQLRGKTEAVERTVSQLRNAYPQAEVIIVPATHEDWQVDPTRCRVVELRLRDMAILPIRTYISREGRISLDDFNKAGDPMIGVLAAMDGLRDSERCLVQYALKPISDDWGRFWRGMANDVGERAKTTPGAMAGTLFAVLGATFAAIGLACLLIALMEGSNSLLTAFGLIATASGVVALGLRYRMSSPPDPALIRMKINYAAFRVRARIFVKCEDAARADARRDQILSAFSAYNLAGGNGFRAMACSEIPNPNCLSFDEPASSLLDQWAAPRQPPMDDLPILNVAEIAMLWHLPHANSGYQGFALTTSKRLAPQPGQLADGVHIGESEFQGDGLPVYLPRNQLKGNVGLIAKTQSGKSNLMAIIASDVISSEPDTAVIVIDPHRDLARLITANLPKHRRANATYWSLADIERPFGLNLLERPFDHRADVMPLRPEKIVDSIIVAFREIWKDNWGPRMEDYLRWPLLTLSTANEMLVADVAFGRWLDEVRMVFNNGVVKSQSAEAFDPQRLIETHLRMISDVHRKFLALSAPRRRSSEDLYNTLVPLFGRFADLYARLSRADTAAIEAFAGCVKDLHTALFASLTRGRRNETGASARIYGSEKRPMQYSLLDVQPMQMSSAFRRDVLRSIPMDTHWRIHRWWNEYDTYASAHQKQLIEMITPVRTKLRQFDASDVAARIFGQPESTVDLARIIDTGGILTVDLAAGVVGQDVAALIGSTILNTIASLMFAQAARNVRRNVLIVVDEFQSIPGADYATMLGELAKYGARVMLGTQSLGVLAEANRALRAAWLDNTNTLFVFRCGSEDARTLADELSVGAFDPLTVHPADIVGLPDHTCFVRTRDTTGQAQVFRVLTRKMDIGTTSVLDEVIVRSRQQHGRDAAEVDAILRAAHAWHGEDDIFGSGNPRGKSVPAGARGATTAPDADAPARESSSKSPQSTSSRVAETDESLPTALPGSARY